MFPKVRLYNNFLDDLFDNVNTNNTKTLMRTNVKENDNGYILEIEIPGVKKENIKLEYHDKYLKVFYKTEEVKNEEENGKYLRRERFSGSFSRSFWRRNPNRTIIWIYTRISNLRNYDGSYINNAIDSDTFQKIKSKLGLSKLGNVYLAKRDVENLLKTEF